MELKLVAAAGKEFDALHSNVTQDRTFLLAFDVHEPILVLYTSTNVTTRTTALSYGIATSVDRLHL